MIGHDTRLALMRGRVVSLGLRVVHLAWDKLYLRADEDVVRVAVGTVHTSGVLHVVQISPFSQGHV